jgi:hypothetical protein
MMKILERLKNNVNKYMADIRPDRLTACQSERKSVVSRRPGRAIGQAVSRRLPTMRPTFKPGSDHVGFCDGQKWRWGRFSPRASVSHANLHSVCFSTIIFTITRGWHNRPGVAAVPIASQTRIKKNSRRPSVLLPFTVVNLSLLSSLLTSSWLLLLVVLFLMFIFVLNLIRFIYVNFVDNNIEASHRRHICKLLASRHFIYNL